MIPGFNSDRGNSKVINEIFKMEVENTGKGVLGVGGGLRPQKKGHKTKLSE